MMKQVEFIFGVQLICAVLAFVWLVLLTRGFELKLKAASSNSRAMVEAVNLCKELLEARPEPTITVHSWTWSSEMNTVIPVAGFPIVINVEEIALMQRWESDGTHIELRSGTKLDVAEKFEDVYKEYQEKRAR